MKQFLLKEYPDDGSGIPQVEIRPMGNYRNLKGFHIVTEKELESIKAKLAGGKDYIEPESPVNKEIRQLKERVTELENKITAAEKKI